MIQDQNSPQEWTEAAWKKAIYSIWDRSCEEPGFRVTCVNKPRVVLEQVSGRALPDDVSVNFDASEDAASLPTFKDAFIRHKPVTVMLPQTKTEVTLLSR